MRHFLLIPCLLAASVLFAQSKVPDNSRRSYAPPVQKIQQSDCFVRKFDAGTSAQRRGDYRAALRLFEEAKSCPEARSSSRRLKELDNNIRYCQERLGVRSSADAIAENEKTSGVRKKDPIEPSGRKFTISAKYARFTDPNCFLMTVQEADRAFRDSCWDDAAKLYRAAKNCADANQGDRERMYNRVEACRAAAEDELLQKEQKAVRTARHALAANLANDAITLLRQGNRSLAWRLADFANFYIAPDDNPDCLDAMYAAYFHVDPRGGNKFLRPAFCYQLSQDLPGNVQFRFTKNKEGEEQLHAFAQAEGRVITWRLPSLEVVDDQQFGFLKAPIGFDVAPDGSFLFFGYDFFYLPNGQFLELNEVSRYCFSEDSEYFLYEDVSTGLIHAINLKIGARLQQQNKGNKISANFSRAYMAPVTTHVETGLLDVKFYKNELWLGYANSILVLYPDKSSGEMKQRMRWDFDDPGLETATIQGLAIFPESREAVIMLAEEIYYYDLSQPVSTSNATLRATHQLEGQLAAFSNAGGRLLTVMRNFEVDSLNELVSVFATAKDSLEHRLLNKNAFLLDGSTEISPSGNWLASHNTAGKTVIWALKDTRSAPITIAGDNNASTLSPDGLRLFSYQEKDLKVYDADDLAGGAQLTIPRWPTTILPEGASNQWAVFLSSESNIALRQLNGPKTHRFELTAPGTTVAFAFDPLESRFFAYAPGNGQVMVKSLSDETTLGAKNFGGEITHIRTIPGTDNLVVVIKSATSKGFQYTVKVWNFLTDDSRVVRLRGYEVNHVAVSEQGDRFAISNDWDIRVFLVANLDDESVVIRGGATAPIKDIAFRPDGLALASGDLSGEVTIWDIKTGQSILQFNHVCDGYKLPLNRLAFAYGGSSLRLYAPGQMQTANLDASTLRDQVQSEPNWLLSFSPEQIGDYQLEAAFKYPGNFDRLAQSGDVPLIRSFFEFFRDQSISSNNIEQVRSYCDRAYSLFELLDDNSRSNLEPTMLKMYKDYILKLLLRSNTAEAASVVKRLEQRFSRPNEVILAAAYTSLSSRDLKAASRLFNDYLLSLPFDGYLESRMDDLQAEMAQFQEYELLDSTQETCLCQIFQHFGAFNTLCPKSDYPAPAFPFEAAVYREVFHAIDSVEYFNYKSAKAKLLEQLLELAKKIQYPNPLAPRQPFEAVVLNLADTYVKQAFFEQNSPKTPVFFQKTIRLLEQSGPFKTVQDTARLGELAQTHLLLGNYFLDQNNTAEAIAHFNAGLVVAKKLQAMLTGDRLAETRNGLRNLGPLYLQLCLAKLLEGKVTDFDASYELAKQYLGEKLKSTLVAHSKVLRNDEIEAFLNYGDIDSAEELAEALLQLERMAVLLPEQATRLRAFAVRLRDIYLNRHPAISRLEADYAIAIARRDYFSRQTRWDSTLVWCDKAINILKPIMADTATSANWAFNWYSLRVFKAYCLLHVRVGDTSALGEVVRYSKETLAWIENGQPYSDLKTIVFTNLAHAYWLRNQPGDRDKAIKAYQLHLEEVSIENDSWEVLQKDFVDLHRSGVQWQDLKKLMEQIKPEYVDITPEEWQEMED